MAQWSRAQEATASGWAWSMGREQIRWTTSVVVVFFLALPFPPVLRRFAVVVVRLIRTTWAAPAKSIHAGASTAWTVRRTRRPWPVSTLETAGTSFQGSFLSVLRRVFWFALTVRR